MDQVDDQGVRVAMLDIVRAALSFLEATRPDSRLEIRSASAAKGLHHIASRWTDIEAVLAQLKLQGPLDR